MNYDLCTPGQLWNFWDQWQECVCGLRLAQSGGLIHEVSHLTLSPEARTSSLVEYSPLVCLCTGSQPGTEALGGKQVFLDP